jgi:hypothetical protein
MNEIADCEDQPRNTRNIRAKSAQTFLLKLKASGVRQKQLEKPVQIVIILIHGNTADSRRAV